MHPRLCYIESFHILNAFLDTQCNDQNKLRKLSINHPQHKFLIESLLSRKSAFFPKIYFMGRLYDLCNEFICDSKFVLCQKLYLQQRMIAESYLFQKFPSPLHFTPSFSHPFIPHPPSLLPPLSPTAHQSHYPQTPNPDAAQSIEPA